jgi:hypothetical protein
MVSKYAVYDIGTCSPGWFGCKAPMSASKLECLASTEVGGAPNDLQVVCGDERILPLPGSISEIEPIIYGKRREWGMLHWKDRQILCVINEVVERVLQAGYWQPGQNYTHLVTAINRIGLRVVDIEVELNSD